jgi:AcrR family transcriptional regulator
MRKPGRPRHPVARSTLLSIAREVFAETGYGAASLTEIARRAGLRKASLFHHFPTKEALYLEALSEMVRELHGHIVEANAPGGSFADRLDRLGEILVRYLGDHRHAARLALRELVDGGPFVSGPGRAAVEATLDATVAFLEEGAPRSGWHRNAARHLALSIIGLHLFYFAAPALAGYTVGSDIFTAAAVEERAGAVRAHVQRLMAVGERME